MNMRTRNPFLIAALLLTATPALHAATTWYDQLDPAVAAAKQTHRDLLVVLHAEWCGWCKTLDRQVFSTPRFERYATKFVPLRLDVEDGGDGSRIAERFHVTTLPMTLVVDPDLVLLGMVDGYLPTEPYIAKIEGALEQHERLVGAYTTALKGKRGNEIRALAGEFHRRGDSRRAVALYRHLLELGWKDPNGPGWLQLLIADALRLGSDYAGAQQAVREGRVIAARQADAGLTESLDLLEIQIATDRGDCQKTVAALESFRRHHPASPYTKRVERTLDQMKHGIGTLSCS